MREDVILTSTKTKYRSGEDFRMTGHRLHLLDLPRQGEAGPNELLKIYDLRLCQFSNLHVPASNHNQTEDEEFHRIVFYSSGR